MIATFDTLQHVQNKSCLSALWTSRRRPLAEIIASCKTMSPLHVANLQDDTRTYVNSSRAWFLNDPCSPLKPRCWSGHCACGQYPNTGYARQASACNELFARRGTVLSFKKHFIDSLCSTNRDANSSISESADNMVLY